VEKPAVRGCGLAAAGILMQLIIVVAGRLRGVTHPGEPLAAAGSCADDSRPVRAWAFRDLSGLVSALLLSLVLSMTTTCSTTATIEPLPARTYRMGFSNTPPRLTVESVIATLEAWKTHGDIALMNQGIPWRSLLADTSAALLVRRELRDIADYYRGHSLPLIVELDVTDGLARDKEAPELVALGRSIAEPAVQAKYREYVAAIDTILHPEYLGLAMETNLIRAVAPAIVYAGLRTMVNAAAADEQARGTSAKLFVSVQVETAWGRLPDVGHFVGVEPDRVDFPFIQAIGLSSYPFLGGFAEPEDVPLDYYARIAESGATTLPMLVVEGGWSSVSVPGTTSTPEEQARWIRRQMLLADRGALVAVTQITFTDFDASSYPAPPGSVLPLFESLGLVDKDLQPKPALAEWDKAFARPLR
jgi:hypothetical protein